MADSLDDLRHALHGIPDVLIDGDLELVVSDAFASIDALEQFAVEPSIVVVCGPSGSGKSTLVNALVGSDVVAASPIRPTTTTVVAIGDTSATRVPEAGEFVIVDSVPNGVVIVDTPAWDRAPEEVGALLERAVLTIVVVTPARYGDQSVDDALAASERSYATQVVANRLPADDVTREQISDAIHERLELEPSASFVEGGEIAFPVSPLEAVPRPDTGSAQRRVLSKALGGVCRRIVGTVTERSTDLGAVQRAIASERVSGIEPPDPSSVVCDPGEDRNWAGVRAEFVSDVAAMIEEIDSTIDQEADTPVATRIRASLPPFDPGAVRAACDTWERSLAQDLVTSIIPVFRKASAAALLDSNAWRLAFVRCELPGRMQRLLNKHDPDGLRQRAVDAVRGVVHDARRARIEAWTTVAAAAGDYRPWELADAVAAIDGGPDSHG